MTAKNIPDTLQAFQQEILLLYEEGGRVLPWRQTTDPYRILVSELMLQQTQVSRVIPKYEAFLERLPTPKSLVDAKLSEVLRLWQGLGYNRRAKYLQQAAMLFIDHPRPTYEQLLSQKGIGPYTAAAVCVFAYNEDRAAIDVNVRRVFNRYFGSVDDAFITRAVYAGRSRDWHNALMDFGATICVKRSPDCPICPLRDTCHALENDTFSAEPSASQPRFKGSVRWHRGALLRAVLRGKTYPEVVLGSLDDVYADQEKMDRAVNGLLADGLITRQGDAVRAKR